MKTLIRKSITLLILLITSSQAFSQYYSRRYPLTTAGFISSMQVVNDTIYTMCEAVDIDTPHSSIGYFVKFNKQGNLLSQTPLRIPGKTTIGANKNTLIRTRDGGFAYGGWAWGQSQSDNSIFIAKYDHVGLLQWYKDLPDTNYLTYYSLAFLQDSFSNYYFSGVVTEKGTYKTRSYVTKVDSQGNLIYFKKITNNSYFYEGTSAMCFDVKGNIVLYGYGSECYNGLSTSCENHLIVSRLDTAGNVIVNSIHQDPNGPSGGSIVSLPNGDFVISGGYFDYKDSSSWYGKAALARLDSNFQILWQIDTIGGYSISTQLYNLRQLNANELIAIGSSQDVFDPVSYNNTKGLIVKIDTAGNILWNRYYKGVTGQTTAGDYNLLYTADFFSDSSIITGAQATDNAPIPYHQQGWLLHLDTTGCLPDSNTCGIISDINELTKSKEWAISLYPIPASDRFTLDYQMPVSEDFKYISVIDAIGREIYRSGIHQAPGSITIKVDNWQPGIYYCTILCENGVKATRCFSVMH